MDKHRCGIVGLFRDVYNVPNTKEQRLCEHNNLPLLPRFYIGNIILLLDQNHMSHIESKVDTALNLCDGTVF